MIGSWAKNGAAAKVRLLETTFKVHSNAGEDDSRGAAQVDLRGAPFLKLI